MKICLAQIQPIKGNIPANIINHENFVKLAADNKADLIVFPELSLTGYEPSLAKDLAVEKEDNRFNNFQKISENNEITIVFGVPLKQERGISISMLIFQPGQLRQVYSKQYLHPDEEEFFISDESMPKLKGELGNIAFSICYELSVPEHAEEAHRKKAQIYLVSAAKSSEGVKNASQRLQQIARMYSMTALMVNSVGRSEGFECGGRSAVWDTNGKLLGMLNPKKEGTLIFDTQTNELVEAYIKNNFN